MLKNQSLQAKLISGFIFVGLITLVVALIGWTTNIKMNRNLNTIANNSLPSVLSLWKINEGKTQVKSSEAALMNVNLNKSQRENEINKIKNAWEQINEGLKIYNTLPKDNQEQQIYEQLKPAVAEWKQAHENLMKINQEFESLGILNPFDREGDLYRTGNANSPEMAKVQEAIKNFRRLVEQSEKNTPAFQAATEVLMRDIKYNEELGEKTYEIAQKDAANSSFWILIGLIIGPVSSVVLGIYFSNTIVKPLGAKIAGVVGVAQKISKGDLTSQVEPSDIQDEVGHLQTAFHNMTKNLNGLIQQVQKSGIQITTSTTQIAASGKQLEATVTEQAASTNQVAATAKEIAATSQQLLKTMDEVGYTSQATASSATESQKDLAHMEQTMRMLAGATGTISGKLGTISEKANNINSIITTITKVADQTNLLSLNAAIEAEKAGEYGTGFAVVAREIRRLADQTAVATLDIENMVKEMQGAVTTGVMEMDK
ncbi:MAG TPA: methyl-accepting chemotaxis protein, partial [Leptolyngbyaceae cyanobacterium]